MNNNYLYAIYSRKSKYTGKGESIENQIELCKKYITNKYFIDDSKIVIYEDEGYSGANTDRPNFKKMLANFEKNNYKMLVVYKLDRVSRNVLDFCKLKDKLSTLGIDFVSITENFDTGTPMGTAMIMISSVFAQLERDTIAERIQDNMFELAKTGRWLGGNTPLGYDSKKIEKIIDGKKRCFYCLKQNNDIKKVAIIFQTFLKYKSIIKVQNHLKNNKIFTKNNKFFSRWAIRDILENMVYCIADNDIISWLKKRKITIFNVNKINNKRALIIYNKRVKKRSKNGKRTNIKHPINEWIIAIGKHEGIISGKDFIKVINILKIHV